MRGQPEHLEIGSRVRLRYAPYGRPGTVLELAGRRVVVEWADLNLTTRHAEHSLILASELKRDISSDFAREAQSELTGERYAQQLSMTGGFGPNGRAQRLELGGCAANRSRSSEREE